MSASFKRSQIWWDCDRKQVVIISNNNRRCHDAAPEPERFGSGNLASLARHCRAILLNAAQSGFKAKASKNTWQDGDPRSDLQSRRSQLSPT